MKCYSSVAEPVEDFQCEHLVKPRKFRQKRTNFEIEDLSVYSFKTEAREYSSDLIGLTFHAHVPVNIGVLDLV